MAARKVAALLIGVIEWPTLVVGAGFALVGLYSVLTSGGFVVHANNPGPGLIVMLIGGAIAGFGWCLRLLRRRINPPDPMNGLIRG
jgi:hypothetical protein